MRRRSTRSPPWSRCSPWRPRSSRCLPAPSPSRVAAGVSPMRPSRLVLRGLTYYWRTNVAVVLGVATAVAVLAGALLVGDSVRGSLRDLVLQRLGRDRSRRRLAARSSASSSPTDLEADPAFASTLQRRGSADRRRRRRHRAGERTPRRARQGLRRRRSVLAVPRRRPRIAVRRDRDALVSPALAARSARSAGSAVLVRVQRPSEIPLESLHGRKDDSAARCA